MDTFTISQFPLENLGCALVSWIKPSVLKKIYGAFMIRFCEDSCRIEKPQFLYLKPNMSKAESI